MEKKYAEEAAEHFKQLFLEQLERAERIEKEDQALDFASLSPVIIGLCPGDGIGPIIFEEAERVLTFLLKDELASGKAVLKKIDGLTLENRLACGETIPKDVLAQIKKNKLSEADYPFEGASGNGTPNVVVVFYVGGTTYEEAHVVSEWNAEGTMQVVLGGTHVLNSDMFMRAIKSL